ncbi:EFR1 family ferrodoxin [Candidatus Harpocratesius sp.]
MRILILYFSGTGNTEYISRYIQKYLLTYSLSEFQVDRFSIESFYVESIQQYDLIFLGFPIYALDAPKNVYEFIRKLPNLKNRGIFLFATKGIVAGNAFYRLYSSLKSTEVIHLGSFAIKMPGTDGLAMLKSTSRYVRKAQSRDYLKITKLDKYFEILPKIFETFKKEQSFISFAVKPPRYILDRLFGWMIQKLYKLMEGSIKKQFWVDDNCTKCQLCVKQCPVNNIRLEADRIIFGTDCIVCMRCIHQCPTESIQIGKSTIGKFRWHGPLGDFHPLSNKNKEKKESN